MRFSAFSFLVCWSCLCASAHLYAEELSIPLTTAVAAPTTSDMQNAGRLRDAQLLYKRLVQTQFGLQAQTKSGDCRSSSILTTLLNEMGNSLRSDGHYADSIRCHEAVLSLSPVASERLSAYAGVAKTRIHFYDPNTPHDPNYVAVEVDTLTSQIVEEFKTEEKANLQVFEIGEEYYQLGKTLVHNGRKEEGHQALASAIHIWKKNGFLGDRYAAKAGYFSAVASSYLGDEVAALEYYHEVAQKYPDFEKAWHAKYMAAQLSTKLAKQGKIDAALASAIEAETYNDILQNDPNNAVDAIVRKKV